MKRRLFLTIFLGMLGAFLIGILVTGAVFYRIAGQEEIGRVILGTLFPSACVLTLAFVLSFILANRISENILKPINRLDVSCPLERDTYPELAPHVQKINAQNKELYDKMTEIKEEHEKQDRMRRDFTANVSHELKTPLTSISGYAEIIRDGIAQEEDVQRFAGKIYEEANRLDRKSVV